MDQIPLENWVELLNKYLLEAEQAIENNNAEKRKEIRAKFHAFIRKTPQKYEFLDDIVRDALQHLNEFDLNTAIRNIKKTTAALEQQRAIIAIATKEANKGAKEIQLEHLAEKLEDTKNIIEKIQGASQMLADKDIGFMEKIEDLKNKINDFKDTI